VKIRALSYDLARSRRVEMPHLKAVIDNLAECRFNMLSLYLEHRFDFPSCPGLAPPGSLTTDMARELTAYGRERGITVIPQVNLIGHNEGLGATERYAHLTCDPFASLPWGGYEQLNLDNPEARAFVKAAISDICAAFPGTYLHMGGDEVRQMEWLFPGDPAKQQETMVRWLAFIHDEVRRHDRRLLMWGDMLLHHETLMKRVPRDILICDWHYGPQGSRETLERFKKEGFEVLAAPAVATCSCFGVNVTGSLQNIGAMVGDAKELDLHGFFLATWEFGYGSGPDQIWPFVAYAGAVVEGNQPDGEAFVAEFAHNRYGVDGSVLLALLNLLSSGMESALMKDLAKRPALLLIYLRKALFRGASPFGHIARPGASLGNNHRQVWEPGPFGCWLFLRPVLTAALMDRLARLAAEGESLVKRLKGEALRHAEELESSFALAESLSVMVLELGHLESAKDCYHAAALAQRADPVAFRDQLTRAADHLEQMRPGLKRLQAVVKRMDERVGLDPGELEWLKVHEKCLDEHINALRGRDPASDSLLEFGDFLLRPAHVTQRLTWR
jgi:hypothetical protein